LAKLAEIEECNRRGIERVGVLSEEAFLVAGAALYAGEGAKRDGKVNFANTNPEMMRFSARGCVVSSGSTSHDCACASTSTRGSISMPLKTSGPMSQVSRARSSIVRTAKPDESIRHAKHEYGCGYVDYHCSRTHREIMGLVRALLTSEVLPG
jgi:hypothetical protein